MQHRDKRVADAVRDAVAEIVTNEISDPRVGFVTVTRCHISRDLKQATVYFTILAPEGKQKEAFLHLDHAKGYIRRRLAQKVKFRAMPELHFALDDVLAHEMRINEVISDLHHEAPAAAEPQSDEGQPAGT